MKRWLPRLLALWRKAFPVRYVLVREYRDAGLPPALADNGEPLDMDDLLPELVEAYKTCTPVFSFLAREHARLEKRYHERMPVEPGPREEWRARMEVLNGQIAFCNRVLRVPISANLRIKQLKELAEKRKANAEELAALEDFFKE